MDIEQKAKDILKEMQDKHIQHQARTFDVVWGPTSAVRSVGFRVIEPADIEKLVYMQKEPWRHVGRYRFGQISLADLTDDMHAWYLEAGQRTDGNDRVTRELAAAAIMDWMPDKLRPQPG